MEKRYSFFILQFVLVFSLFSCRARGQAADAALPGADVQPSSAVSSQTAPPVGTSTKEAENNNGYLIFARGTGGALSVIDTRQGINRAIQLPTDQHLGTSLSPSGEKIAFYFDGYFYVHMIATGETSTINSKRLGSLSAGRIAWASSESQIIADCFPSDTYPISEVCLFDLASGEVRVLTGLTDFTTETFAGVAIGGYSSQANMLAFSLQIPPEGDGYTQSVIFVLDLETGALQLVFDERSQNTFSQFYLPRLSPDGTKILIDAKVNGKSTEVLLLDVLTGSVIQLTNTPGGEAARNPFWIDAHTFIASQIGTIQAGNPTTCIIYTITGEIVGDLACQEDWFLLNFYKLESNLSP